MNPQQPATPETPPSATATQESIFNDWGDTKPYEKSLKTARIWLYIIAALQVGIGIYEYNTVDESIALFALLIDAGIGVVFLALALWSYKKPAASFLTAIIAYALMYIILGLLEPQNLYKGVLLKIFIVIALVKAYKDAREVEKMRASMRVQ